MRSNNFDVNVTVTMWGQVEALAKNYSRCEPILIFFFVRLTAMKREFFRTYDFFGPVLFKPFFIDVMDRKWLNPKKGLGII